MFRKQNHKMSANEKIRKSAVAGQFYSALPVALREDVEDYLASEKSNPPQAPANMFIAPHAGYVFSAPVAARAYARIPEDTKTVILIGPSHHKLFDGIHVTGAHYYETPLGLVEVDQEITGQLKTNPLCRTGRGVEEWEHCLEVQLPFLQVLLGKFTIVPIYTGKVSAEAVSKLLLPFVDDSTVVIASSDLSHYLSQNEARDADDATVSTILSGRADGFMDGCGETAIRIVMDMAAKKGLSAELLDARTSYETAPEYGDPNRVVGYAAVVFYRAGAGGGRADCRKDAENFTQEEKKYLLDLARTTLESAVNGNDTQMPISCPPKLSQDYGCFVTLNSQGRLRGCIGNIEPVKPLCKAVIDNTVNAAFYDPRFSEVKASELSGITIEISVLTAPRPLNFLSADDLLSKLVPFEHGVILKIGARQSTFLPQVWEQLPDKVTFLEHLSVKAGAGKNDWKKAEVLVYEGVCFAEEGMGNGLARELERLVKAGEKGNFDIVLDDSGLSGKDAETASLLNAAMRSYGNAVEYDLMKYRLANDALNIALWDMNVVSGDVVNPDNKFTWSQEFRRTLGFTDESDFPNVQRSWSDRLHPEDKEQTLIAFAAHINDRTGRTPYNVEYRLMLKDGQYRYFHAFGTTLRDSAGVPQRVAGALMDVTEKRQMMDQLEYREKMLGALNDMAVMLLSHKNATLDEVMSDGLKPVADAGGLDRIAVYRMLYEEEQRLGQIYLWYGKTIPLDEELVILPDNPPIRRWLEILMKGECINGNTEYMLDDDVEFLTRFGVKSIFFVPIFTREKFWGVITLEDHNNHRYFEEQCLDLLSSAAYLCAGALIRAEMEQELKNTLTQANAASKAKGDFLSTMSHEMRTPMNAIIGMTAIGKNTEDVGQKNHALDKIGEASSHLLSLINDVLDMAKIEANKLELMLVEYNFEKMLQKVLAVINFRVDEKRQSLSINIDKNIPSYIFGDDHHLAQVITNLLTNAVKFTPTGGKIRFEASLACENDGNCELRIEVSDNGIGIPAEQQEKMFDEFEQGESGMSRKYGGTGLGLAISKRIVELMGGKIWVESELDKGAKFIFTIKAQRGKKSEEHTGESAEKPDGADGHRTGNVSVFAGKKILLAEDVEINREILITLLEDTGITIDCAENGEDALNMITETPEKYDAILM
ncbi:MAG: AmmeMemoRadiSam system protein B, partial [Chitinispirillales bacterium]|nr:AmmeMemoRadiSam system protein B [Chitinispirillales bacterium]